MSATVDSSRRTEEVRERVLRWRALAALYGAGSAIGAVSLVLPHSPDANLVALWSNITLAVVTGTLIFVFAQRLPVALTHVGAAAGTVVVGVAVNYSGDSQTYYSIWWVWIALYAFSFYDRRAASAHVAFVGLVYGVVLAKMSPPTAEGRWLTTIATLAIAAVFVDKLVRLLRRHAANAEQNRVQLEKAMVALEAAARTDDLTGLPNRRSWDEELHRALAHARRFEMTVCVALLDLDGFKELNDAHGHRAGDDLLRDAARAWSAELRDVDTVTRWGGDEFAVIVPGCDIDAAADVIERVRRVTPAGVTCSAGLVAWDGIEEEAALVARADAALYRAKRSGRDRLIADRALGSIGH